MPWNGCAGATYSDIALSLRLTPSCRSADSLLNMGVENDFRRWWMLIVEAELADAKHLASKAWTSRKAVEAWLRRKGYSRLDKPAKDGPKYGSTWTDNSHRSVVKVFHNDPCYPKFINFCRANRGDPHLPRASKVFTFGETGIVFLELLQPNTDYMLAHNMHNYLHTLRKNRPLHDLQKPFVRDNPSIIATLDKIHAAFPSDCDIDLHIKNIMWRGKTIVITDPLAPP